MLETLETEQTVQAKRQTENSAVTPVKIMLNFGCRKKWRGQKQLKHMPHQNSLSYGRAHGVMLIRT